MTIRHALFIDGAWTDANADRWPALVTVTEIVIEIKPYLDSDGRIDVVRFSPEEFAAIVALVTRLGMVPVSAPSKWVT